MLYKAFTLVDDNEFKKEIDRLCTCATVATCNQLLIDDVEIFPQKFAVNSEATLDDFVIVVLKFKAIMPF